MEKLLAPFDRESKELSSTISMQGRLDIMTLEKSLIERKIVKIDREIIHQDVVENCLRRLKVDSNNHESKYS